MSINLDLWLERKAQITVIQTKEGDALDSENSCFSLIPSENAVNVKWMLVALKPLCWVPSPPFICFLSVSTARSQFHPSTRKQSDTGRLIERPNQE